MQSSLKPLFLPTPAAWRKWLEENHSTAQEVLVGFYKKKTGKPSMTWQESVEEALCFGWIDGIRRSIDEESYYNRFTPRRARSNWSDVNIKLVEKLIREGRMQPTGLKAFEARDASRMQQYASENPDQSLSKSFIEQFKANKPAWEYFTQKAPGYKKNAVHWVMSAKQEITREKRFQILLQCSENQTTIPLLTPAKKK